MAEIIYNVKNRSASTVVYRIPEDGIRREFAPGEVKKISKAELTKLSYRPGGPALMTEYLQIMSAEAVKELGLRVEPEYNMNEQQITELLKTGSMDAFLDCLEFAPVGVVDLVKKIAVSLPLNDFAKREAIKEKTGFDVTKAIANAVETAAENRRTNRTETASATSTRRTSGSAYQTTEEETSK